MKFDRLPRKELLEIKNTFQKLDDIIDYHSSTGVKVNRQELPEVLKALDAKTKKFELPKVRSVVCTKGNVSLGFVKRRAYPVESLEIQDDYSLKIVIRQTDRKWPLYIRHPNWFNKPDFPAHNGDPTRIARFRILMTD